MANPNVPDPNDPRQANPLNPTPPLSKSDDHIDNRTPAQPRSRGGGMLIALVVIVLAIGAYYFLGRSDPVIPPAIDTPAATDSAPAPTEPAPAEPAPDEAAPAAPAN